MIDFTNCVEEINCYKGSEKKKTLLYNNKKYLVKFPDPISKKNISLLFSNNAYSEYIGSNVFKLCDKDTQNTILGKYLYEKKEKIVCACEDFTTNENQLYEFESLALSTNPDKKIETELSDIMEVIDENKLLDKKLVKDNFWEMFIIDSLIGNTDRHNGNWGFLINNKTKEIKISPIYDCGSCLNPLLEDKDIEKLTDVDIKNLALNTYSCFKENGKKINYLSFIKGKKNIDCNNALKRIFLNIKIDEIINFIDNIECISNIRKEFYKKLIKLRYEILKKVYKSLN